MSKFVLKKLSFQHEMFYCADDEKGPSQKRGI